MYLSIASFVSIAISVLALTCAVIDGEAAESGKINAHSACPLQLVGPIVKGDFEKFAQAAQSVGLSNLRLSDDPGAKYSVCLNSAGGSWIEGIKIARYIFDNGIGTRIEAGTECYSACAIIFMSGRIRGNENDGPWRYLSARGRLGFHAPYLVLGNAGDGRAPTRPRIYTAKNVEDAFDSANRMMSAFMFLFSYRSTFMNEAWIRSSLIAEMSSSGRSELVSVDTVGQALRWGISLYDLRPVRGRGKASLVQLCLNVQSWLKDERSKAVTAKEVQDALSYPVAKVGDRWRIDTGGMAEQYCLIKKDGLNYSVCAVDHFSGTRHGNCPEYGLFYLGLAALAPNTPIRSLADGK